MYSRWVVFGTKFSFFVFVSSVLVSGSDKHVGQYVSGSLYYAEILLMLARMFSSSLADNLVMRCPPDLLAIIITIIRIIIIIIILIIRRHTIKKWDIFKIFKYW